LLILLTAAIPLALGFWVSYRNRQLVPFALAIACLAALAFFLSFAAVSADYRDADGFMDCWPNCSAFQQTVGTSLFIAPLAFLLSVGLIAGTLVARSRRPPG
jgi:hypothetical protein